MRHSTPSFTAATLVALVALVGPAVAEQGRAVSFSALIGAGYGATYEGSDRSEALPILDLNASFAEGRYFLGTRGIGIAPILTDTLTVKAAIGYGGGRKVKDDPSRLAGLGDLDDEALAILNAEFHMGTLTMGAEITGGADYGATAKLALSTGVECTDRISVGGEVAVTYADGKHMQRYFGVTGEQSAASGKAVYSAGSGLKSASVTLTANYALTDRTGVTLGVEQQRLLDDAADSPIARDADQTFAFLGVSAHF